jgi:type I restriction enzyme M protein
MLHGFNAPYVFRDNLLTKPFEKWMAKDQYDVILSNPPFGGIEENGTENNFPSIYRTKETADLFVVLIIKLLKKNGRAAVILPDGFLYGEGVRTKIKEYLLNECNLHTIVRLPKGVFNPYTGIKTNLLFFQKGTSTKDVWYFEHSLPDNQKSYSRSKPISIQEFESEKSWWNNRNEQDNTWKVSIEDIKKRNYNLDISSPYFGENEQKYSTKEIILLMERSMQKVNELLTSIKFEIE